MVFDIPQAHTPVISFKASAKGAALNFDREARTIRNVVLAKTGEAKGWDMVVEQSFLQDMAAYVSKTLKGRVQCNMGHNWDNLFLQMGRFSNLRMEGDQYIGDLTFYKAADISPKAEGMVDWVFELAQEDPQALMMSIRFKHSGVYQYDAAGKKKMLEWDPYRWEWRKIDENQAVHPVFKELYSCDIIDEGALTDSLFSAESDLTIKFAEIVHAPGFMQWFKQHHARFTELDDFYQAKHTFSLGKLFTTLFSKKDTMEDTTKTTAAAEDTQAAAAGQPGAEAQVDFSQLIADALKPLQDKITAFEATLAAKDQVIQDKDARIAELSAQPAAEPTPVQSQDPSRVVSAGKSYLNNPINQKARAHASV